MQASTLGAICDSSKGSIQTGPFGSQLHRSDYREQGVPVVMPQDIIDDRVDESRISRVDEVTAQRMSRHYLRVDDIVFPRRGDIAKRAIITANQSGYLCGTGCLKISLPPTAVDPRFLFYFLAQRHIIKWIEGKAVGSTMLNLNTSILRSLPVTYPDLYRQRQIVKVLTAYDDLIENNQRRIKLLEEAARRLYSEWFVALRFPGHERVKVMDGVPQGWERIALASAVEVNPLTRADDDDAHPFVTMQALSESSMVIADYEMRVPTGGAKFRNGDTLLARITPCLENGKTGFVQFLANDTDMASGSTEFIVLRSPQGSPYWVYCLARDESFRDHAIRSMVGSDGRQRINTKLFDQYQVLRAPKPVFDAFDRIAMPIFQQVQAVFRESQVLKQARDALLPRLMSGAIAV